MTTLVSSRGMSKKKSDVGPGTLSVKLHMDVIEAARIVAAYRNETLTDLLSDILRPALAKMEQQEVVRRSKREGSEK